MIRVTRTEDGGAIVDAALCELRIEMVGLVRRARAGP